MKLAVIGAGYVGLTTATCLACVGHRVSCVEINEDRLASLRKGIAPFYEPGLSDLVEEQAANGRLSFFGDTAAGIAAAELVFIAVGTPAAENGSIDTSQVINATEAIAACGVLNITVVNRCTCPPGTGNEIRRILGGDAVVLANPEFLREGTAVDDFMHPDRIIIGADNPKDAAALVGIYEQSERPVMVTSIASAELMKFAANAYLAASISFINGISGICEKTGADVKEIEAGMRADRRIGLDAMISAGVGYGGGCLPKDVSGMASLAEKGSPFKNMLEAISAINENQKQVLIDKARLVVGAFAGKKVAIWGLSFKPGSDDIRESNAVAIAKSILLEGAIVVAHDPKVNEKALADLPGISVAATPVEAAAGADLLLVLTAWPEYLEQDLASIGSAMASPVLLDGRNVFDPAEVVNSGFKYFSIGRPGHAG